jgi:predicted DNA-binding antitoxin AbrB/MazE fold protein
MNPIHAIYENGVFRPTTPVDLPEGCEVTILPGDSVLGTGRPLEPEEKGLDDIYEVMSRRYRSGHADTAERHNEHQP